MGRREFYLLVAETGLNPKTVRDFLNGGAKTHVASAHIIRQTAERLGIELSRPSSDAHVGEDR